MFVGLVLALLIVAGAATVIGGSYVLTRNRQQQLSESETPLLPGAEGEPFLERTIRDLRVGDIVQHHQKDFLVEGVVAYDEDGHRWSTARLVDGRDVRWLFAGFERGAYQASLYLTTVEEKPGFDGYPPQVVFVGDVRFQLQKRGTASAKFQGDVGSMGMAKTTAHGTNTSLGGNVERCRWWRYDGDGDAILIVEQWNDIFRTLRGKSIPEAALEFIPGS